MVDFCILPTKLVSLMTSRSHATIMCVMMSVCVMSVCVMSVCVMSVCVMSVCDDECVLVLVCTCVCVHVCVCDECV